MLYVCLMKCLGIMFVTNKKNSSQVIPNNYKQPRREGEYRSNIHQKFYYYQYSQILWKLNPYGNTLQNNYQRKACLPEITQQPRLQKNPERKALKGYVPTKKQ